VNPTDGIPAEAPPSRTDLLRQRTELLDALPVRTRLALGNIDFALGWPPAPDAVPSGELAEAERCVEQARWCAEAEHPLYPADVAGVLHALDTARAALAERDAEIIRLRAGLELAADYRVEGEVMFEVAQLLGHQMCGYRGCLRPIVADYLCLIHLRGRDEYLQSIPDGACSACEQAHPLDLPECPQPPPHPAPSDPQETP
jgi:hypothetical protein